MQPYVSPIEYISEDYDEPQPRLKRDTVDIKHRKMSAIPTKVKNIRKKVNVFKITNNYDHFVYL